MKDKKQVNWTLIIVLALAIFIWAMYRDTTPKIPATPTITQPSTTELEREMEYRDMFMDGCNDDGAEYEFCSCGWTELRKVYTVKEIAIIGLDANEGVDAPQAFYDAVESCYRK